MTGVQTCALPIFLRRYWFKPLRRRCTIRRCFIRHPGGTLIAFIAIVVAVRGHAARAVGSRQVADLAVSARVGEAARTTEVIAAAGEQSDESSDQPHEPERSAGSDF